MTVQTTLNVKYSNTAAECCNNGKVGPYDVLCGRNKTAFNNVGNRRFRINVSRSLDKYMNVASTRKEKSQVIRDVIMITKACGGRFIVERNGTYEELSKKQTHEKVGHAVRDMLTAREKLGKTTGTCEKISEQNNISTTPNTKAIPEGCRSTLEKKVMFDFNHPVTVYSNTNNNNKNCTVRFAPQQNQLREDEHNITSSNYHMSLYKQTVPSHLVTNISLSSICEALELERECSIASIDSHLTFDRDFFEFNF